MNGEERQSAGTDTMLHPVASLLAYITAAVTLEPGDVLLTGTPAGVGPAGECPGLDEEAASGGGADGVAQDVPRPGSLFVGRGGGAVVEGDDGRAYGQRSFELVVPGLRGGEASGVEPAASLAVCTEGGGEDAGQGRELGGDAAEALAVADGLPLFQQSLHLGEVGEDLTRRL
ncbi:fumarylacetoacetate hydrolase family protein [Streptomyces gardneri]|uniref:fumarylacetoacetate hydrolase family protein n=1 Tax=Streptomyces gardneri TaxID=66892 RepID=UPI0035DE183B